MQKFIFSLMIVLTFCNNCYQAKTNDSLIKLLSSPNEIERVKTLNALAFSIGSQFTDSAIRLSTKALILSEKNNWLYEKAISFHQLGLFNSFKNDEIKTLENYLNALQIWESLKNLKKDKISDSLRLIAYSKTLNNIGVLYNERGNFIQALEFQYKALKISEQLNDKKGATAKLTNLGNLYADHHDWDKAREYYEKALSLNIELKNQKKIANTYNNIGSAYYGQKNYETARKYFMSAVNLSKKLRDTVAQNQYLTNLAALYMETESLDSALALYNKVLGYSEKTNSQNLLVITYGNIGRLYTKMKNAPMAFKYLTKALELSRESGNLINKRDHYGYFATYYKMIKNFEKAMEYYVRYNNLNDSIYTLQKNNDLVRSEMNYLFNKKTYALKMEQEKKNMMSAEKNRRQELIIYFISFALTIGLVLILIIFKAYVHKKRTTEILKEKNEIIKERSKTVTEKQEEILDSIRYAQRIQKAHLPNENFILKNLDRLKNS